jgi:hypothetical protein
MTEAITEEYLEHVKWEARRQRNLASLVEGGALLTTIHFGDMKDPVAVLRDNANALDRLIAEVRALAPQEQPEPDDRYLYWRGRAEHAEAQLRVAALRAREPAPLDREREESVAGAVADYVGNRADLDAVFQARGWYPEYGRDYCREVADLQRDLGATVASIYRCSSPAPDPPAARALAGDAAPTPEREARDG